MRLGTRHLFLRCLVVWLTATGLLCSAALVGRSAIAGGGASPTVTGAERALVSWAGCAVLTCALWLWAATTTTVLEALRDARRGRARSRCQATGVRRCVLLACGVAVVTVPAAPAIADAGRHSASAVSLPYPDRAAEPARGRQLTPPRPREPSRTTVVVHRGDSLWTIARGELGASASDADVTERVLDLYVANRPLIGPDPDLIRPGQRLTLPRKDPT